MTERNQYVSRRRFLGMAGAGAALSFLPPLAYAEPGPGAPARRLLILNLLGGIRSSAAFLASHETRYNPYGLIAGTSAEFPLGRILDDTPPGSAPLDDAAYTLGAAWQGARVPRFREIASAFSVVGTWSLSRGDHVRARIEEPTGSAAGGEPGLLTRVGAGLAQAAGRDLEIPPFHLEVATMWGHAPGALSRYAPVSLASHQNLPSSSAADPIAAARTGHDFAVSEEMRSFFDDRRIERRAGRGRLVSETFSLHRRAVRTVGARLAQPDFAVGAEASDAVTLGTVRLDSGEVPLTNAMVREVMAKCVGADPMGTLAQQAVDAALAVRMLQAGSPAVVLEISDFDFHSGERTDGPPVYSFLGRLWATLSWLLARVPDPSGEGTLLDRTLVTAFSDFGRDGVDGGWNGGEGTDHGVDASCFYLAHPVMGAGVRGGRLIGGVSTSTYDARSEALQISPQRWLATMLRALGLDSTNPEWGFPDAGSPVAELWS
jgi:uncharacterized protein (DUF1501 family)